MGPKIALQEQAWQTGVWVRALPASAPSPPGLPSPGLLLSQRAQ